MSQILAEAYARPKMLTTWAVLATLAFIIVMIILIVQKSKQEHLQSFYLDQIAMQSTDPAYVKFVGRERDPLGMSMRDYYLEHTNNSKNLVEADYSDDQMFYNTTDYLQMPKQYRPAPGEIFPKTLSRYVMQPDNVVAQDGEYQPETPVMVGKPKTAIDAKKTDKVDNRFLK
jgi:hypothetical protein